MNSERAVFFMLNTSFLSFRFYLTDQTENCIKHLLTFKTKRPDMKLSLTYFTLITFLLFTMACQNSQAPAETATNEDSETETNTPKPKEQTTSDSELNKKLVYAWVDKLNIRNEPGSKGKAITEVKSETPLELTGAKSDKNDVIVLRGVAYDEPWLKVITPDKKEGWVYGGAVKREGEQKGNDIVDDNNFDFPHFGKFNLDEWKKQSTEDESGGDADITTTTYVKGKQKMKVTIANVGDYGYSRTYSLTDDNNNKLKEREFEFTADAESRKLIETVKDYTSNPPITYTRSQKMEKHYMQLNAWPLMVNGPWSESN